jgi:cytochrome c peroxidase
MIRIDFNTMKRYIPHILSFGLIGFTMSFYACNGEKQSDDKKVERAAVDSVELALQKQANDIFGLMPDAQDPNSAIAVLGKKLYFETALSVNKKLSCNSCHMLDKYGVDNLPTSPGHAGKNGDRNSPTVYNADVHLAQFWDGRAEDLIAQAKGPILNPIEMGLPNEKAAVERIRAISEYKEMFAKAFPDSKDPITYQNIASAIAAFEKTLRTPSPFDAYMKGDASALSEKAKQGMKTFIETGCTTCHIGAAVGGGMYMKFGLANGPYWEYTHSKKHDRGRAEVTKNAADEFFFKVPSLRNIAKTAPYFHDGSVEKLDDAIKIMAKTQLNKELNSSEIESIRIFLESLSGSLPKLN